MKAQQLTRDFLALADALATGDDQQKDAAADVLAHMDQAEMVTVISVAAGIAAVAIGGGDTLAYIAHLRRQDVE